jgi:hypothetical protein
MEPSRDTTDFDALSRAVVDQILITGVMLADLVGDLVDGLPDDAFPGEQPAEVILEMLAGSAVPVVRAAGPDAAGRAVELLLAIGERTLADLRTAAELARRREVA